MIRSSKFQLEDQTRTKNSEVIKIYQEYVRLVNEYIRRFYYFDAPFNMDTFHSVGSFIPAMYKSNANRQAYQIVQLIRKDKKAKCPIFHGEMKLDHKLVDIYMDNPNSFDLWIRLTSTKFRKRVYLPCRRHKQFNKWLEQGTLKQAIAIKYLNDKLRFRLCIDIPDKPKKESGETIGCDVGYNKLLATSDNKIYGKEIKQIVDKIYRRQTGSKRKIKSIEQRQNYVGQELNKLNLSNIHTLVIEDIKELKKHRKMGKLQYWSYRQAFDKLERLCQENCVHLVKVNPAYTSQKCSTCGFVDKANRLGERFKCLKCGTELDADFNASLNIRDRSLESLSFHRHL